jgi:hypothetical protein
LTDVHLTNESVDLAGALAGALALVSRSRAQGQQSFIKPSELSTKNLSWGARERAEKIMLRAKQDLTD